MVIVLPAWLNLSVLLTTLSRWSAVTKAHRGAGVSGLMVSTTMRPVGDAQIPAAGYFESGGTKPLACGAKDRLG